MKESSINILGVSRPLCFSTRVMCACTERYGDLNGLFGVINGDNVGHKLNAITWLLAQMMDAGTRYKRLLGEESPAPVSQDDLLDLYSVNDLGELIQAVQNAMQSDQKRDVEAEPPKNGETTQGHE